MDSSASGSFTGQSVLGFPKKPRILSYEVTAGAMEYLMSFLGMYEHSISQFCEDKLFLSMWWVLLAKAKGRKSWSELCYKNTPWGCSKEKNPVRDGVVKGRSWQWRGHWFHKAQYSKNVVILLQTWAGSDGDRLATAPPVKQSIHHRNQDLFIWCPNSIINISNSNSKKSKNPSKAFWWFYHPQYQRNYWQGKPSIKALMWYRGKWLNSSK